MSGLRDVNRTCVLYIRAIGKGGYSDSVSARLQNHGNLPARVRYPVPLMGYPVAEKKVSQSGNICQ